MTAEHSGWLAGGLMAVLMLYPLRKYRVVKFGSVRRWFTVHFWVGFAAVGVAVWHAGVPRSVNGAMALGGMLLLTLAGVFGRAVSARYPRALPFWTAIHVPLPYLVALVVAVHAASFYAY